MQQSKNSLAVLSVFRNEADVMEEFLQHNIWFGVDKFYLVNNNSDDDWEPVVKKYENKIKMYFEPKITGRDDTLKETGIQISSYNKILKSGDISEKWLLICDIDEFFYMRKGTKLKTLLDYLEHNNISQLLIPLKTYNSCGLIEQPKSIRKSFIKRHIQNPSVVKGTQGITKALVRISDVKSIGITASQLKEGKITTDGSLKERDVSLSNNINFHLPLGALKKYRFVDDDIFLKTYICCNHYTTMSYNRFFNVKATRGIGDISKKEIGRVGGISYWKNKWKKQESKTTIIDTEMRDLLEKDNVIL
jgi:hypothetical protein